MSSPVRVDTSWREVAEAIARLVRDQSKALRYLDDRLGSADSIGAYLDQVRRAAERPGAHPLVARSPDGEVLGFGLPRVRELPAGHEWLAWAPRIGGVWDLLALEPPGSPRRGRVLEGIVREARRVWRDRELDGETVGWFSADSEFADLLHALGLETSSHYAYAPVSVLASLGEGDLSYRPARAADYASLWRLREEQLQFHLAHCRFERSTPGLEGGFRRAFEASLSVAVPVEERPQFSVAEHGGEILGFVETAAQPMAALNDRGLPEGRYGYLNNAAVRADRRGSGLGRGLVRYALGRLTGLSVRAFVLWYAADNPASSRFWPAIGFQPLYTRFERRRDTLRAIG